MANRVDSGSGRPRRRVAVIGSASTGPSTLEAAEALGRRLAQAGLDLVCGGRGGVMEAAARGSRAAGGETLGILPGTGPADSPPNPYVDVVVYTGVGQARNLAVVLSAEVVMAVGGGWGTLSEIALARKYGRPVVLLGDWELSLPDADAGEGLHVVASVEEAVERALALVGSERRPRRDPD